MELAKDSLLVVYLQCTEADPQAKLDMIAENTSVIKCALNYIPEPIQHMKLVFSAILLSFARDSGWDQLLYVITQLPTSYLPRIDHLCMAACNV